MSISLHYPSPCRRLAKDFEPTTASAVAWIYVANIRGLTRKLPRP
jgi:putative transposase